ncbi:MAG TPA: transcription factor FapR [Bacillales bacterium]|nr:transcription factor FapR [Bacillales bacterium]
MKQGKKERQKLLKSEIADFPFITDEELARKFQVSVQTIRLDRMELSIPEVRQRIKAVAQRQLDEVKALPLEEVIGEIVDLQLDESAISILDIGPEHVFSRTKIVRGHHLFAQANSLAVAIINDELALTAKADIRFNRQVKQGERVVAKARIDKHEKHFTVVAVDSYVDQEQVFSGTFTMYRSTSKQKEGTQP